MVMKMAARRHVPTLEEQASAASSMPSDADSDAALLVGRSIEAQGLPPFVSDSSVLGRVARLIRAADAADDRSALPNDGSAAGVAMRPSSTRTST